MLGSKTSLAILKTKVDDFYLDKLETAPALVTRISNDIIKNRV